MSFFDNLPPAQIDIESFLHKQKISHVLCTLSSPYQDLTNSYLIKKSKKNGIPTFGVMDHWKGYNRFFDERGEMGYFPDFIGCIDEFCKKKLLELCNEPDRIYVIGHPYLETFLSMRKPTVKKKKEAHILIISQPDTRDRNFDSIFLKKIDAERVIDKIISEVKRIQDGVYMQIKYRPHPKEKPFMYLLKDITVDKTGDWEEAVHQNDIFLGLDSMLLVEASLAGKYCIFLCVPEFLDFRDAQIPYKIWEDVGHLDNLGSALQNAIKRLKQGYYADLSELDKQLSGSLKRSLHSFGEFINCSEGKHKRITV